MVRDSHTRSINRPSEKFWRSVLVDFFQQLVVSLVLSRLDRGNATLVGLPIKLLQKLQSVLNASARLIFGARRDGHVTVLMKDLHWLRASERITFKVAVPTFQCLHGTAPDYLAADLRLVANVPSRSRLRSAFSSELMVPRIRLSTVVDRAFPVAAARIWNSLPYDITSAETPRTFKNRLKTFLFRIPYA
jgi:hypothetical protein